MYTRSNDNLRHFFATMLLAVLTLVGCGGRFGSSEGASLVTFTISWPTDEQDFVHMRSNRIRIRAYRENDLLKQVVLSKPNRTAALSLVPIAQVRFEVDAYDSTLLNPSTNSPRILSSAIVTRDLLPGTTELTITLDSKINKVQVEPKVAHLTQGSSRSVSATGYIGSSVVLTRSSDFSYRSSSSSVASVTTSGTVTGSSNGIARIKAEELGNSEGRSSGSTVLVCPPTFEGILIPEFTNLANFKRVGSPSILSYFHPTLGLINTVSMTLPTQWQQGAIWSNSKFRVNSSFECYFRFIIKTPENSANLGADGIAFVIQNASDTQVGNYAMGIGYEGIPNSLAVEVDSYSNFEMHDPDHYHVAVQSRGTAPNSPDHANTLGIRSNQPFLLDGQEHSIRISYRNPLLQVYIDDQPSPAITAQVDIASLLSLDNGRAWVGFTAATGYHFDSQLISQFVFAGW